jgi:hypothetical protein
MHPCTFQAVLNYQLVGALDHATAQRPALGHELWVAHLCVAFLQIRQRFGRRLQLWMPTYYRAQFGQHTIGAIVLELLPQPCALSRTQEWTFWRGTLPNQRDMFPGMRQIQNAQCLGVLIVNEGLAPLGTIYHRADMLRTLDPTPMQL